MRTRAAPLFSLSTQHDYYGGPSADVGFVLLAESAALVRGTGLVARSASGAMTLLHDPDDAGPRRRAAAGKTVRIGIVVSGQEVPNVTAGFDLSAGLVRYRNSASPRALDDPPARFTDAILGREGLYGVAEITVAPSFFDDPPAFAIPLRARAETMRYYVVAKGFSNGDTDSLAVADKGAAAQGRPAVPFDRIAPADLTADEKSRVALLGEGGAKVIVFRSQAQVARRLVGRRGIQLVRGEEPLIESLPQPGRERATADVIVHLSKSKA